MDRLKPEYDLFLSYNSADRDEVSKVLAAIRSFPTPISTFFDRANLPLGELWFDELEIALSKSRAVAVFYGKNGLGRWQKLEIILALDQQASRDLTHSDFRVIPVLLPGADLDRVPRFLLLNTFADLRSGEQKALEALAQVVRDEQYNPNSSSILNTLPLRSDFRNPYRGLNYFREEDAPLFFGREEVSRKLLKKVKSSSFVTLVGSSGSGKSSVVRAGIIPLLRREHSPAPTWEVIICVPGKSHESPFHNLVNSFLESWNYSPDKAIVARPAMEQTIRTTLSINDCIAQTLKNAVRSEKLLLVIDQFEELVTSNEYKTDFVPFTQLLLNATKSEYCTILITIRGDYYGRVIARHQRLADFIAEGVINLSQMEQAQLREVIERPAILAGAKLESGLANLIIKDVEEEPGNLALLEYALTELWNHQREGWLTHQAYNDLVGGLQGAIRKKADETLESLLPKNRRLALSALTRLVRVAPVEDEGGDTRQRVFITDFSVGEQACLEPFVKARLLVTHGKTAPSKSENSAAELNYDTEGTAIIEVAHEALIRHWPRLKAELKEKRDFLSWRQSIRLLFNDWQKQRHQEPTSQKIEDSLLEGRNLKHGLEWVQKMPLEFNAEEREFVIESERRATRLVRKSRMIKTALISIFISVFVFVGSLIWLIKQPYSPEIAVQAALIRLGWALPPPEPCMISIAPIPFVMGSDDGRDEERPRHPVTIAFPLTIGVYEVTFEEYDSFVNSGKTRRPSDYGFGRGKRPVIDVTWDDSVAYAKWLSYITGKSYRLPTEAEWEFAVTAGAQTQVSDSDANCCRIKAHTTEVGEWPPNKVGLHDMFGNVAEWVKDCWHSSYANAPSDGSAWLEGDRGDCNIRMIRGGSWNFSATDLRPAARNKNHSTYRSSDLGFRLVQDFVTTPNFKPACAR